MSVHDPGQAGTHLHPLSGKYLINTISANLCSMVAPILQVALDLLDLERAVEIAREAVCGGADWIEAGTPLIKSEGMQAIRRLHDGFPDHEIVADMKVADAGAIEVEMAAKSGASIICILADADDAVIAEAVRSASKYGVRLMADLINVHDPISRSKELQALGVDYINAHVGIDQQMIGRSSLDLLHHLSGDVTIPIAVAGGLDATTAAEAVAAGASIIIVGGNIIRSADVTGSARTIRDAIHRPEIRPSLSESKEDTIRRLFEQVSAPNVTDAMHRKGAMSGVFSICGRVKIVGRAVTVRTIAGDWAKPVEAIDIAGPGDVIVISNDGGTHIAPWGELATLSCKNRGIAGVVIDGAVRDVDDIRRVGYPIFARAAVPNAGEPKGHGEINTEIVCCGQEVRAGDWIVADESGVVVVPRERAYEIARRALEVRKTEERIREEIRRGRTLSEVMELLKWEKR
jgi:3-hexulose-6-phosphate synthase/6-phospho-3-hexuloisomerase